MAPRQHEGFCSTSVCPTTRRSRPPNSGSSSSRMSGQGSTLPGWKPRSKFTRWTTTMSMNHHQSFWLERSSMADMGLGRSLTWPEPFIGGSNLAMERVSLRWWWITGTASPMKGALGKHAAGTSASPLEITPRQRWSCSLMTWRAGRERPRRSWKRWCSMRKKPRWIPERIGNCYRTRSRSLHHRIHDGWEGRRRASTVARPRWRSPSRTSAGTAGSWHPLNTTRSSVVVNAPFLWRTRWRLPNTLSSRRSSTSGTPRRPTWRAACQSNWTPSRSCTMRTGASPSDTCMKRWRWQSAAAGSGRLSVLDRGKSWDWGQVSSFDSQPKDSGLKPPISEVYL